VGSCWNYDEPGHWCGAVSLGDPLQAYTVTVPFEGRMAAFHSEKSYLHLPFGYAVID
jgi:hypothetical protein